MSPDKITEARSTYSDFSLENLMSKDFKVVDLRKIAPEIGISHITREGKDIPVNNARKDELAQAIYAACEVYRVAKMQKAQEVEEIKSSEYPDFEQELQDVAHKYYEGVFDSTAKAHQNPWKFVGLKECVTRALAKKEAFVPEFFTLVSSLKPELESRIQARTGNKDVNPRTLHNWKSQVLKKIEQQVERDASQFPNNELQKAYGRFYEAVQATFQAVRRERIETSAINLSKRQDSALDVRVSQLIQWAKDTVTNLPESPAKWREVAIAIMILTGRRQSEVMSSAKFEPTDSDDRLSFSGQLKRHSDESVAPLDIPVLGSKANAVLTAVEWLESHGKREIPTSTSFDDQQKAAKKAHDRFSRYLSETAKEVCEFIGKDPDASWYVEREGSKPKDRRNCHLFRQIYGQVVIPVFFPHSDGRGRKPKQILTEVMGHSNRASSQKHAAEAYDSDVFVVDIDEVITVARS